MKQLDRRLLLAIAAVGLALAAWMILSGALVWSTLESTERETVGAVLGPRIALLGLSWLVAMAGVAYGLHQLFLRYASAPARLLEQTRVLLAASEAQQLTPHGSTELRALGAAQESGIENDRPARLDRPACQPEQLRIGARGGFRLVQV